MNIKPNTGPQRLPFLTVKAARKAMKAGMDLKQFALSQNVNFRDLDASLWFYIGERG